MLILIRKWRECTDSFLPLSAPDLLSDTKMYCLVANDSFASLQPSTSLCPSELSREPADLCSAAAYQFSLSHSSCDTEVASHTSLQSQTFRKELRSRGLPRTSSSAGCAFPDPYLPDFALYPPPRRAGGGGGLDPVCELDAAASSPHRFGLCTRDGGEQLYQQDQAGPSTSGVECCRHKEPRKVSRSASREAGEGSSGLYSGETGGGAGKGSALREKCHRGGRSADSLRSLSTRSSGSTESYCSGTDRDTNSTVSSFHSEQTSSTHVESLLSLSGDERARDRGDGVADSRTSGGQPSREANKNPHANELTAKHPTQDEGAAGDRKSLGTSEGEGEEPGVRTGINGSPGTSRATSANNVQRTSSLSAGRKGRRHSSGKKRASSFDAGHHRDHVSARAGAKPGRGGAEEDSSDHSELSGVSSRHLSTDSSSSATPRSCPSPAKAKLRPEPDRERARGKRRPSRRTPSTGSAKTHARVLSLDSGTAACLNDPRRLGAPAEPRPLTTSKSDLEAKEGEVLDAASLLGRASQLESVTRSRNSLPSQAALSEPQDAAAASLRGT